MTDGKHTTITTDGLGLSMEEPGFRWLPGMRAVWDGCPWFDAYATAVTAEQWNTSKHAHLRPDMDHAGTRALVLDLVRELDGYPMICARYDAAAGCWLVERACETDLAWCTAGYQSEAEAVREALRFVQRPSRVQRRLSAHGEMVWEIEGLEPSETGHAIR